MSTAKREITFQLPDVAGNIIGYFEMYHAIEAIGAATWLRWAVVTALALAVAFWHQRQNKSFHAYIRDHRQRTPLNGRLSQLAYNRSFETLGLFFVLIATLLFYDTRLNAASQRLTSTETALADHEQQLTAYETLVAVQEAQLQASSRLHGADEQQQEALDMLKQEFEGLFINYYVLQKCNLGTAQDFHILHSALMYRLSDLSAPANIRQNILDAAHGSFTELYAEQDCKDEANMIIQGDMQDYLHNITRHHPHR